MDEMTSSEFRRRYASLTEPTVVTVLGRPIGQWMPAAYPLRVTIEDGAVTFDPPPMKGQPIHVRSTFRPAPKPSAKGK